MKLAIKLLNIQVFARSGGESSTLARLEHFRLVPTLVNNISIYNIASVTTPPLNKWRYIVALLHTLGVCSICLVMVTFEIERSVVSPKPKCNLFNSYEAPAACIGIKLLVHFQNFPLFTGSWSNFVTVTVLFLLLL